MDHPTTMLAMAAKLEDPSTDCTQVNMPAVGVTIRQAVRWYAARLETLEAQLREIGAECKTAVDQLDAWRGTVTSEQRAGSPGRSQRLDVMNAKRQRTDDATLEAAPEPDTISDALLDALRSPHPRDRSARRHHTARRSRSDAVHLTGMPHPRDRGTPRLTHPRARDPSDGRPAKAGSPE